MDFSSAGYEAGGGVALPVVPVVITIGPVSGDNTSHIQAAINTASQLAPDINGFRGAVLLGPGTYDLSGIVESYGGGRCAPWQRLGREWERPELDGFAPSGDLCERLRQLADSWNGRVHYRCLRSFRRTLLHCE
jgi:hypothetical protein